MAHIRKQPGCPAYQTDEHGNPISSEDCLKPVRNMGPLAAVLGGQEEQQDQIFFEMIQHSGSTGDKKEKLKEKIKKKMEGGNKEETPITTAHDENKIDPQLLSRGSQLKAMGGSSSYAKSGPK